MFRIPALKYIKEILLSNERLIDFLNILPFQYEKNIESDNNESILDVIAWEFFRQIISPLCDPLDKEKILFLEKIITKRSAEIGKLKDRCLSLAIDFKDETDLNRLQKNITSHIKLKVKKDIQDILDIDKHALEDFIASIFSDEKTWLAIGAFIFSLFKGGPIIKAGAALGALSYLGAKSVKLAVEKHKKLRSSDFALIYRMKNI